MKARHYRDLQVWQRSMALARDAFQPTEAFPRSQMFGLTAQMQRSAVSIPSNIAEGHGRLTDRSFAQFLSQARGSLNELETQTKLSRDMGFANSATCGKLLADIEKPAKMLNALLTAVRNSHGSKGSPQNVSR